MFNCHLTCYPVPIAPSCGLDLALGLDVFPDLDGFGFKAEAGYFHIMPSSREILANICTHVIFPEARVIGLHFCR